MDLNELRRLALHLLANYQAAWEENAALHVILDTYPMPDCSVGIPGWRKFRDDWVSDSEAKARVDDIFAPLFAKILRAQEESEVLDILRRFPKGTGEVN